MELKSLEAKTDSIMLLKWNRNYILNNMAQIFQVKIPLMYWHYLIESIIKCYKHLKILGYDTIPDYNMLKFFIQKDLEEMGLFLNGVFDWSENIMIPAISYPILPCEQMLLKSLYEREYRNISLEEHSMEADYKDFMSIESEEGI